MNRIILVSIIWFGLIACKSRKKKAEVPATNFFPAATYIRGELKRLDTAQLSFTKIETENGRSDTIAIKNTEVRLYAKDFVDLPDISLPELKDDYEVSQLYDDMQEAFVFHFTTKEAHPLREENITVDPQPNAVGKNDIKSIYAKLEQDSSNIPVTKILMWEAGTGFYTTTAVETPGKGEQIKKVRIIWNSPAGQSK